MVRSIEKITLGIIFVFLVGLNSFFIFGQQETNIENNDIKTEKRAQDITEEQAREIALNMASGTITELKEKTANGVTYYDVEIEGEFIETEMKIAKKDGNIFQIKQEEKDDEDENEQELTKEEIEEITGILTEEEAEKIALATVPGVVIEFEAEYENGKLVYEFEIDAHSSGIADVEIDPETGDVLDVEWDD